MALNKQMPVRGESELHGRANRDGARHMNTIDTLPPWRGIGPYVGQHRRPGKVRRAVRYVRDVCLYLAHAEHDRWEGPALTGRQIRVVL